MDNLKRNSACKVLRHYMQLALQGTGKKWTHDNDVEVDGIVDDIIAAAREPQLTEHAGAVQTAIHEHGKDRGK
jgi:hypothetical protein